MSANQLRREYNNFFAREVIGAKAELVGGDIFNWIITFRGPVNSPYKNGTFRVSVKCSSGYPLNKPDVKFLTPVFHPNVDKAYFTICYGYLDNWDGSCNLSELAIQLFNLLANPYQDSPLNSEAEAMWYDPNDPDHEIYQSIVESFCNSYV